MRRAKSISLVTLLILAILTLTPTALAWELERPARDIDINERVENSTTNGVGSIGLGVHIAEYFEDSLTFDGKDVSSLRISATANTRMIIDYKPIGEWSYMYQWHDVTYPTYVQPNDGGAFITIPGWGFRFYGGPRSAEYWAVWVCENGFIILYDPAHPENFTNPYYLKSIPDEAKPNCFIAPFWQDLDLDLNQGGSITWGIVYHGRPSAHEYLCISWNGVPNKKNGIPQTFQVLLETSPPSGLGPLQSRIWFQYKSITLDDPQTTVGIEDQGGWRGESYNYLDLRNDTALYIEQGSNSAYIWSLTIRLGAQDANAYTMIGRNEEFIRGNNVELRQELPEGDNMYEIALRGPWTLLISAYLLAAELPPWWLPGAGFMLGTTLYIVDWAREMAKQQELAKLLSDWHTYAEARAINTEPAPATVVDADFGFLAFWIMTDPNNMDHSLTVTAELDYFEVNGYGNIVGWGNIPTSVTLKLNDDDNDDFASADYILLEHDYSRVFLGGSDKHDFYQFLVDQRYVRRILRASMTPPQKADFDLYLYDPMRNPKGNSTNRGNGIQENLYFNATSTGYWYIEARNYSNNDYGFYTFRIDVIPDLNGDGIIDIFDLVIVGAAFGSKPGDPDWNSRADVNNDNIVDIFDLVEVGAHFGEQYFLSPASSSSLSTNSPVVSVYPNEIVVGKYETISVNVTATNVTNLYGWEFKLYWNSSVLNCTSAKIHVPGVWSGNVYEVGPGIENKFNSTHGRYWKALSAQNPAPPFNGSMPIVTLTFKAMATGGTTLDLQGTKLADRGAYAISHTAIDGSATVHNKRYMRSNTHTINGLTAYNLGSTQSNNMLSIERSDWGHTVIWGIRVWVRHADGTETELTGGTPVAIVFRSGNGEGIQSSTWNCPETSLVNSDAIVVRVYAKPGSGSWTICTNFITAQLSAGTLQSSIWTIYYYTKAEFVYVPYFKTYIAIGRYHWGTTTANSHIENILYT